jgi:o-succinylbenzoate synthase
VPQLLGLEWVRASIPFRRAIGTAIGTHTERSLLFLHIETDNSEGWGEFGALADGTSVDPNVDELIDAVRAIGMTTISRAALARDGQLLEAMGVARLFSADAIGRFLASGFEMAVLDAELRAAGQSFASSLNTAGRVQPIGAAVGIPDSRDPAELVDRVGALVSQGVRRIRLKIAPDWDTVPLDALRRVFPDLMLAADANGSFTLGDDLDRLDPYDLAYLEQPLSPHDLAAHFELTQRIATPICLDESLSSPRRVTDAIRYKACDVACLKPARLGGVWATRKALADCEQAGMPAFVGGFFETGLGRSANLALGGLSGFSLPGDLVAPDSYLVADPFGYPVSTNGEITAPQTPGIAPLVDPNQLEEWIVAREHISYPS